MPWSLAVVCMHEKGKINILLDKEAEAATENNDFDSKYRTTKGLADSRQL